MTGDWQTVGALVVVITTVIFLVLGGLRRKRKGGDGCPGCQEKPLTVRREEKRPAGR